MTVAVDTFRITEDTRDPNGEGHVIARAAGPRRFVVTVWQMLDARRIVVTLVCPWHAVKIIDPGFVPDRAWVAEHYAAEHPADVDTVTRLIRYALGADQ